MRESTIRRPIARSALVAAAAVVAAGCSGIRLADAQRDYYQAQLGSYRYEKSCLDVWPSVLKLLGSKGYPLQGRDRAYAGEGKESGLAAFVDQGDETQAVAGGGLYVKTGWLAESEGRSRYEVTGTPGEPSGCVVAFTRIWSNMVDPSDDQRSSDWRIQLELLKQVEPSSAARVEGGAPKGG